MPKQSWYITIYHDIFVQDIRSSSCMSQNAEMWLHYYYLYLLYSKRNNDNVQTICLVCIIRGDLNIWSKDIIVLNSKVFKHN